MIMLQYDAGLRPSARYLMAIRAGIPWDSWRWPAHRGAIALPFNIDSPTCAARWWLAFHLVSTRSIYQCLGNLLDYHKT